MRPPAQKVSHMTDSALYPPPGPVKKAFEFLDRRFVFLGIFPTIVVTTLLILYPCYMVFKNSLFLDIPGVMRFVGLKQYIRLGYDPQFWVYLGHTFLYSGLSTAISFGVGMTLALCLNGKILFRNAFRVSILIPWAIPGVVSALIFKWFFNDIYGAANDLLMGLGVLTTPLAWLSDKFFAMAILIFCDTWIRIPFVTVVLLAGLQTVPKDLYDAGKIDGAGEVRLFTRITLPCIKGAILVSLLITSMFSFREVALMLTLTGGGPGDHTKLFSGFIYENAFVNLSFGYTSALSVVMLLFIMVITVSYFYLFRSEEM